jgi:biopolymer transport protein ExbB
LVILTFAMPGLAWADNGAGTGAGTAPSQGAGSDMLGFLFGSVIGYILLLIYFIFVALIVWLILDLRSGGILPLDFLEAFEDAMNKRKYKEAFDLAKQDHSVIAKVMTAGMTRLQHGLDEARNAAEAMIESLKARKDHVLAFIAIIGTLGPLIGLVGTVSGMITSFAELGHGGTPNPARLAAGISHALNATLVGILLSCLAIPAYTFLKNRLARLTIDVSLMADDLLTQMFHASRKPGGDSAAAMGTKTMTPSAAVVKPTET